MSSRMSLKLTPCPSAPLALAAICTAAVMTSCATFDTRNNTVAYTELPPGVQDTIDARLDVNAIEYIERKERENTIVYDVHGQGPNGSVNFTVTQDGAFVAWDSVSDAQRNAATMRNSSTNRNVNVNTDNDQRR